MAAEGGNRRQASTWPPFFVAPRVGLVASLSSSDYTLVLCLPTNDLQRGDGPTSSSWPFTTRPIRSQRTNCMDSHHRLAELGSRRGEHRRGVCEKGWTRVRSLP